MAATSLQPYDIFMLVVLGGTILFGYWKGMAWQFASLASIVLSTIVAIRFGPTVAGMFSGEEETEPWNQFLAMLVLFLVTSLAVWAIFRLVANFIDRVKLKEFDRQAGALLGLVKGVLFCLVITFFAVTLSENLRGYVLESHSGKYMSDLIERAQPILSEQVAQHFGEYVEKYQLDQNPLVNAAVEHLKDAGEKNTETKPDPNASPEKTSPLSEATETVKEEGKSRFERIKDSVEEKVGDMIDKGANRLKESGN